MIEYRLMVMSVDTTTAAWKQAGPVTTDLIWLMSYRDSLETPGISKIELRTITEWRDLEVPSDKR